MRRDEQNWKRKIHRTVSPASALVPCSANCQEVIAAAVCRAMNEIKPVKIRVRLLKRSMMKDPQMVKTRYTAEINTKLMDRLVDSDGFKSRNQILTNNSAPIPLLEDGVKNDN